VSDPKRLVVLLRRLRSSPDGVLAGDVIGACERAALAAAVTLGEEHGAHVTALAIGGATRENRVLAMALRAGCQAAVRIEDGACGALDYLGVARLAAAYCRREGFDLILAGARSQDEQQGAVGPAVAEELGIGHAASATDLRFDGDTVCTAPVPGSGTGPVTLGFPCLVTVARFDRRANAPTDDDSEADAGHDRASQETPLPTLQELDPDDLGIDPRELRHRNDLAGAARPSRVSDRAIEVPSPEELVARLRADHLIDP